MLFAATSTSFLIYFGKLTKSLRKKQSWLPIWEAKWIRKLRKNDVKSKHVCSFVFFIVFIEISWISAPKFWWFFNRFLDSEGKGQFCKNSAPACTGARFSGFWRIRNQPKKNKKSMQNKITKMIETNCKNHRFWHGFGKSFERFWTGLEVQNRWQKPIIF